MKLHHSALIALCAAVMISVRADTITCQEKASVECEYYNDIECCENSGCDDEGTPKCNEEICCRDKPQPDEFYCEAKKYDCEYKETKRECCEEEGCDDDDEDKPVCSEEYCCKEKDEDEEYDLTCASVEDVDPRKRCNNGKDVIEDKECCRYSDRCSEGYEQMKCLHSFCCERDDRDDKTCEDIYDCDYKDKDMDCGDDDEDCTLEACCNDTDPDGKYDVFCDEEILEKSDPDTDECRQDDEELIEERACCRYSNRCSRNWTQKKCLYSNCCGKDGGDGGDGEGSVITCEEYYEGGAECDGEEQNNDEDCKDRDSSSMACSKVCCKKDEECPPIDKKACECGRVEDKNGCPTNECKECNEAPVITCEEYYEGGATCDGEEQNDDEDCKDRDSSSMACSEVCCKKAEECPPIDKKACECGRVEDENDCPTNECKECNEDTVITCEEYYDNGADCDGEKQNDDEDCKDRDSSSMACSEVCCKKDEECPPIDRKACECGRVEDDDGCETNECKECEGDDDDDDDTSNDKKCEDEVDCDDYAEDECCANTDKCSDGYEQSKCTESFCCE